MMKRVTSMVAVASAILSPAAAIADPALGSRLGSDHSEDTRSYSTADAGRSTRAIMSCAVAKFPMQGRALLSASDIKTAESAAERLLRREECNMLGISSSTSDSVQFHIPLDVMRGMAAEELLNSHFDEAARLPRLSVEKSYTRPWFAVTGRDSSVDAMAVCLAEINAADDVGLLRTEAYSPAEMAAVQTLGPSLGQCLQVGYKLHANRQTLRAAIAEGLYHRLMDPVAPVPAAAGK